jgi:hypothetical protein
MAYRDYGEGPSGPGGEYEHRDRMGGENRRGWMERARDYVERARDLGRDVYERAQAERFPRGGPGSPRDHDLDRYPHGEYGRGPGGGQVGGYGTGYGDPRGGYGASDPGGYGERYGGGEASFGTAAGGYYGPGAAGGQASYGGRPSHAGRGSRYYRRSDARIEEEVHEALMRHHEIDATDIDVRVENGAVTLTGHVEDRRTRRLAEEVVEQLPGVRDVDNQLRARGMGTGGAAMDALDPTRPTRDPDGPPGSTRDVTGGMRESGTGMR